MKPGICLLSGRRRFFVNQRQYPGQPPAEVAANVAGLSSTEPFLKVASTGLTDVLLHGNICKGVACTLDFTHRSSDEPDRPDNVCFFDLRPTGLRPLCHYQVGEIRHIPSVLEMLDVHAPPGYTLAWDCASSDGFATTCTGDTVIVRARLAAVEADAGAGLPPDAPDSDDDSDRQEDSEEEADTSDLLDSPQSVPAAAAPAAHTRPRSRSPRRYGGAGCAALAWQSGVSFTSSFT